MADPLDRELLARATAADASLTLGHLTGEVLRELAVREGLDFATALLFDRVRRDTRQAEFIARLDRLQGESNRAALPADALIAIVPAPFYREMRHSGADGRVVRETAAELDIACELVPVRSAGTLAENAAILREWLRAHHDRSIILASLCKGGADVKFALSQPATGETFAPVVAWMNICGTLSGSHIARWLLASRPRSIAAWIYCRCQGHSSRFLRELAPSPDGPLAAPLRLPAHVRFVSVVGFPLRRHLTNAYMRRCHALIAPHGPNDGGVLLSEVCRLPGALYPVWGADHYLRPDPRARAILGAVFSYLAEELSTGSPARKVSAVGAGR